MKIKSIERMVVELEDGDLVCEADLFDGNVSYVKRDGIIYSAYSLTSEESNFDGRVSLRFAGNPDDFKDIVFEPYRTLKRTKGKAR